MMVKQYIIVLKEGNVETLLEKPTVEQNIKQIYQ
jgi:hypothetical protein